MTELDSSYGEEPAPTPVGLGRGKSTGGWFGLGQWHARRSLSGAPPLNSSRDQKSPQDIRAMIEEMKNDEVST